MTIKRKKVFLTIFIVVICFSKYGKGTEKVWNWGRVRVRKKYHKFKYGYVKLSNLGTEKREGYGLFKASASRQIVRENFG